MADEGGKQLKFKFVVDEASARQVNRVFDDMIKKAQELSKILAGLGGGLLGGGTVGGKSPSAQATVVRGGAQTQKVSFASLLGQNTEAFKKMADTGGNAMKVMTDAIKRAIGDQQRELKGLDSTIATLSKRYEQLGKLQVASAAAPGRGGAADFYSGARADIQEEMIKAQGRRAELLTTGDRLQKMSLQARATAEGYGSVEEMYAADRTAAGLGGGGIGKRFVKFMGGGPGGSAGKVIGNVAAIGVAANVLAEAGLAVGTSQANFQADRNRMFRGQMAAIRGGDLTYGLATLRAQRMPGSLFGGNAMDNASSGLLSGITTVVGGGMGAVHQLIGAAKGGGSVAGAIRELTPQAAVNRRINATMDILETNRQAISPHQEMALNEFAGSVQSRIRAQRLLGMGGFGRTGNFDQRGMAIFADPYSAAQARLQEQGYSLEEKEQSFVSIRSLAGSHAAGRYADAAMRASAGGFAGYDQLLSASARLVGSDMLARGALGGRIDTSAGIQLGQAVLGTGFDINGTTSGRGSLAAIQAGMGFTGSANDFNKVQTAIAGMNFGDNITKGGLDPYQQGRNLVSAMGIVPGGSSYTQDYLANGMSMKQMIDMARPGSKMTETAKALGLTSEMIQGQLSNQMSSVFDRYVDQNKQDPMSVEIRRYRASKMGINEYLQKLRGQGDLDSINALGVGFSQLTGGAEGEGIGLARVLSGMDVRDLTKRRGGPSGGAPRGAEADYLKSQAEMSRDISATLKGLGDDVAGAAKAMPEMFKTFSGVTGDMNKNAEALNSALKKITDVITQAAVNLDRQQRIAHTTNSKASAPPVGR